MTEVLPGDAIEETGRALAEAWAREAATREILQVISRSRADEAPVFEAILDDAARLCAAPMASLSIVNEARTHVTIMAHRGTPLKHYQPGVSQVLIAGSHLIARAIREQRPFHNSDIADDDLYRQRDPVRVTIVEKEGVRTFLAVPLISGGQAVGCIALYRREVKPFTNSQIELVETFAEQAVIAIENVRQFRELQTRLEREAATREILEVISRSRNDEKPVFDVILENAARLCDSPNASLNIVDEGRTQMTIVAHWGEPLRHFRAGSSQVPLESPNFAARAVSERRVIHCADLTADALYRQGDPTRVAMVDKEGGRSLLIVPLIDHDQAIGCITLFRREVKPFARATSISSGPLPRRLSSPSRTSVSSVRYRTATRRCVPRPKNCGR